MKLTKILIFILFFNCIKIKSSDIFIDEFNYPFLFAAQKKFIINEKETVSAFSSYASDTEKILKKIESTQKLKELMEEVDNFFHTILLNIKKMEFDCSLILKSIESHYLYNIESLEQEPILIQKERTQILLKQYHFLLNHYKKITEQIKHIKTLINLSLELYETFDNPIDNTLHEQPEDKKSFLNKINEIKKEILKLLSLFNNFIQIEREQEKLKLKKTSTFLTTPLANIKFFISPDGFVFLSLNEEFYNFKDLKDIELFLERLFTASNLIDSNTQLPLIDSQKIKSMLISMLTTHNLLTEENKEAIFEKIDFYIKNQEEKKVNKIFTINKKSYNLSNQNNENLAKIISETVNPYQKNYTDLKQELETEIQKSSIPESQKEAIISQLNKELIKMESQTKDIESMAYVIFDPETNASQNKLKVKIILFLLQSISYKERGWHS